MQLDGGGVCQVASQRVHAELVGVLHTDLVTGGIHRDLAGEIVEGAEQIDICSAAEDFGRRGLDAGGGLLSNANPTQGDTEASGIEVKGI